MTTSRHQTVLTLHENQAPANVAQVLFTSDETLAGQHPESYWMDLSLYEDMGQPAAITLTVEPGDLLNNDPVDPVD